MSNKHREHVQNSLFEREKSRLVERDRNTTETVDRLINSLRRPQHRRTKCNFFSQAVPNCVIFILNLKQMVRAFKRNTNTFTTEGQKDKSGWSSLRFYDALTAPITSHAAHRLGFVYGYNVALGLRV